MNENRAVRFINRIATGAPLKRWLFTGLAPLFFASVVIIFVVMGYYTDHMIRLSWPLSGQISLIIGIIFISIGSLLILWCVFHFLRARGTPVPFNPPRSVITKGPYQFCRNPMISGLFAVMCGSAFLLHSVSLLVFYLPLFILLNYLELKHIEEPELEKRFGPSYREYKTKIPMFLPRISKKF